MHGFIWKDMKRSFLNVGFFCRDGFRGSAFIDGSNNRSAFGSYQKQTIIFVANVFAASGFGPFAAVFPVLAYATRFCEEYQSGYYRMIFQG